MAKIAVGTGSLTLNLQLFPDKAGTKFAARQAKVNALIRKANEASSLADMLSDLGVRRWGEDEASTMATNHLLVTMLEMGLVNRAVYDVIWYALQGHPDASAVSVADAWTGLPTLQSSTEWDEPKVLRLALDRIGQLDPEAADLLANVIIARAEKFKKDWGYHDNLLHFLADAFWRGKRKVLDPIFDWGIVALVAVAVVAVVVVARR